MAALGTDALPQIVGVLKELALAGDTSAAGLLLNRLVPALKPTQEPTRFELQGETLSDKAESILDAISEGRVSVADGKLLIDSIGRLVEIAKLPEIEERIAALEAERSRAN